eukprot:5798186-Pyramimonas_sp.AAC.1
MDRTNGVRGGGVLLLHFTGPPVPITARMHSTLRRPRRGICRAHLVNVPGENRTFLKGGVEGAAYF